MNLTPVKLLEDIVREIILVQLKSFSTHLVITLSIDMLTGNEIYSENIVRK